MPYVLQVPKNKIVPPLAHLCINFVLILVIVTLPPYPPFHRFKQFFNRFKTFFIRFQPFYTVFNHFNRFNHIQPLRIGATIRTPREILCLLYMEFLYSVLFVVVDIGMAKYLPVIFLKKHFFKIRLVTKEPHLLFLFLLHNTFCVTFHLIQLLCKSLA